jgi:hypothetical protein
MPHFAAFVALFIQEPTVGLNMSESLAVVAVLRLLAILLVPDARLQGGRGARRVLR